MKQFLFSFLFSILTISINLAQSASLTGVLSESDTQQGIPFANVVLHNASDSTIAKIEVTDDVGIFRYSSLSAGEYYLQATYVGMEDLTVNHITLKEDQSLDLGKLKLQASSVQLETATVTAKRAMIEVKADRKIFNVEGTINSTGDNGISLLRKAPGVILDNNDNISVLGRSGVLIYVDGKRIPYQGQDLADYLRNISSDQIDRMEIITNPGAKYEAEGNAGIIDIILKRDKSHGTNGTVNGTYTFARKNRYVTGINLNHRNKLISSFGSLTYGDQGGNMLMTFDSNLNGFFLQETNDETFKRPQLTYKAGSDFYLGDNHILGFVVNGATMNAGEDLAVNITKISNQTTATDIDSTLQALNQGNSARNDASVNLNYRYKKGKTSINADVDYGSYTVERFLLQPNVYYEGESETEIISQNAQEIDTPTDIIIRSAKLDIEREGLGGTIGIGGKLSSIATDNTFLFSNIIDSNPVINEQRSNTFLYDEQVEAAYISYARQLTEKLNLSSGLRMEHTDSRGDLSTFDTSLTEPPVEQDYINWFPNVGLSYQYAPMHAFSLSYGRRINRPDYNVLNPFRNQMSELSIQKGNPFLRPEIVNNVQLNYTMAYRYNFSLSYSRTEDQITRLIGPDEIDPKASFINWDNLTTQTVISANASLPFQISDPWTAFVNLGVWRTDNQAEYENGSSIDIQVLSWNTYFQSTYNLTKSLSLETSGWVSGPGVWGGTFKYDPQWSLNFGVQKKFLNDRLVAKVAVQDVFLTAGWSGTSVFNGLESSGTGNWDSRRLAFSLNYKFGNDQVKASKRKTGIEDESGRAGGDGGGR